MNSHGAEFLIVGGHAVAYHGYPRFTGDIDLLIRTTPDNTAKVLDSLEEFGFPVPPKVRQRLTEPGKVIHLGRPPNRIDLLTSIDEVDFETAWEASETGELDGLTVRFLDFDHLIRNKKASGRPKDLADVAELLRVRS